MEQSITFDLDLIRRYDTAGPRYTSYPTAVEFNEKFNADSYKTQVELSNQRGGPLSLYFHLPFCETVCFYWACNKIITKNRKHAEPYLANLHKEIAMQAALFDSDRIVEQLHWGGGTPTFISHDQMRDLMTVTRQHFNLADDANSEFSIEIDPREADAKTIAILREIGFNRISLGVQDFNPQVQKAVNRIQSETETVAVIDAARANGFRSVSLDLIYGLPLQTADSFSDTLNKIIDINPDRISVFNYAHLPERFKVQRQMRDEDMPLPAVKLEILQRSIEQLTAAGYIYIGMDHFAKPDDELAVAQRNETLYRNFQGYSTHAECDLVGMGATSISLVNNTYAQNRKGLDEYYQAIDAGDLAVFRGVELTEDDELRRDVITRLISHFHINFASLEQQWNIRFKEYFAKELPMLTPMVEDGLMTLDDEDIYITAKGRLLIRNICMVFDAYLKPGAENRFSKVI
ncbi:MAG: oxygen-independent coproporphyrinogen III oxidase [Thiomicrorhabdus sp.]|nr:oxygen-independent coproporphyrinogen III oxidase [Thiomicrorhabdus sp.]